MSLTRLTIKNIHSHKSLFLCGRSFAAKSKKSNDANTSAASSASSDISAVPGLSSKVLSVPDEEVGSGASKNSNYKNPEYFCYHQTSYFDAELEMLKFRVPQPSAARKQ